MAARTRRPSTTTIPLSGGDSITVKTHPNSGDTRQMVSRMYTLSPAGEQVFVDPIAMGLAKVLGYLLDWTFTDHNEKPIVIADQPEDVIVSALGAIDPEDYSEVLRAIEAHDAAMAKVRLAEKNGRDGATALPAISPSPASVAGASSGSES